MDFGIGNVINPANLALAAAGPAGWAAIAARTLMSSIGQEVIQQLGQQLGLPQSTIDLAQSAYAGATGDYQGAALNAQEAAANFAEAYGASPTESGDFQRDVNDAIFNMANDMAGGEEMRAARAGGRGGSWLIAIAQALGEKLDAMAQEMTQMANNISDDTPSLTTLFSAKSQQFGIMMNAASTAIKTLGESLANTARKQ